MSNFYTKTGDNGTSSLLGNASVPKNHPRLEAVGAIDEADAALGVVRSQINNADQKEIIITIQHDLYNMMSEISATPENAARFRKINHERVAWLEKQVEIIGSQVQIPQEFILPGDTVIGAFLDIARTIVRKAERRTCALFHTGDLENRHILAYLNRLSTYCFIYELFEIKNNTLISLAKNSKS